jgi:hypothetical protein
VCSQGENRIENEVKWKIELLSLLQRILQPKQERPLDASNGGKWKKAEQK